MNAQHNIKKLVAKSFLILLAFLIFYSLFQVSFFHHSIFIVVYAFEIFNYSSFYTSFPLPFPSRFFNFFSCNIVNTTFPTRPIKTNSKP